jgi:8-amino-7-oxononanoate synthase
VYSTKNESSHRARRSDPWLSIKAASRQQGRRKPKVKECHAMDIEGPMLRRRARGILRQLPTPATSVNLVDFSSNDYLGLARSRKLFDLIQHESRLHADASMPELPLEELSSCPVLIGSGGSRLLSGNSSLAESIETDLAKFHERPAALVFSSGYAANLGVMSCIPQKEHVVVYDELAHNSTQEGLKLGRQCLACTFRHNDCDSLESVLEDLYRQGKLSAPGCALIVVESVYSMDGDLCPLERVFELAQAYGAKVIVDEAHATGLYGVGGRGRVHALGLNSHSALLCAVHTFGKALGVHGGAVLCSDQLRLFLINYARPFIYTTAPSVHSLIAIRCSYRLQEAASTERARVFGLVELLLKALTDRGVAGPNPLRRSMLLGGASPILAILVPGSDRVSIAAALLQDHGFDVKAVQPPTVKEGTERLRVCLHSFNTTGQVEDFAHHVRAFVAGQSSCSLCTCKAYPDSPCKCHDRRGFFRVAHLPSRI